MQKRKWLLISIIVAVVIILLFLQWLYLAGFITLTPRIKGTVTLHLDGNNETYDFGDRQGGYDLFNWNVGTDELPIEIELFNRNDWHIIRMNFDVTLDGEEWLVTGDIKVRGYDDEKYEKRFPVGEKITIKVDCFP